MRAHRLAFVLLLAPAAAAAAPAARVDDLTSHGGRVLAGSANVLVGGQRAARVNDFASCPLVTPPSSPHVGGPIVTGAATVLINGRPAARAGDTVAETGAASVIVTGSATVQIGTASAR